MPFALAIDVISLRLDLRNVLHSSTVHADLVIRANEERHRHLLDVGHLDQVSLRFTVQPVSCKLLESISQTVHDPVLL